MIYEIDCVQAVKSSFCIQNYSHSAFTKPPFSWALFLTTVPLGVHAGCSICSCARRSHDYT